MNWKQENLLKIFMFSMDDLGILEMILEIPNTKFKSRKWKMFILL